MKKIKGLLLFGILTLLGIGSSFGTFFELNDLTGSQLLIPNYSYSRVGNKYSSTYNYTLGTSSYHSGSLPTSAGLDNRGVRNLYVCRDSNLNILGFSPYAYIIGQGNFYTFPFGDFSNCSSFNELTNFEYVYLSNSISISPYSTRSTGNINSYIYFDDNSLFTNYGSVRDVPIGYTRQKLFLSFVGNYGIFSTDSGGDYLFTSIGRDSFNVEDLGDGLYNFDLDVYSGILELHYSDYSLPYYSGSRTVILSLGSGVVYFNFYTGYYYGIKEIQDGVLPLYKGYLIYNNSSSEGYIQFINFLNNGHKIVLSNGGNNGISFTSYGYNYFTQTNLGGGYFTTTSNLTLNFEFDDSVPTFITPSGNGNQSTYSGTVSLNNCIDTQICWDYTGSEGSIIRLCTTECVSSGVIASGGYIGSDGTYYFVNSPISIEDSLKTDNPENMFTGSYIESGGILSLSYFTDYFQPGAKKIGVCPFKYYEGPLDFMTKLKVGDVYLLMPVLCFYSAFQQGKNVSFFDEYSVNDGLFSQPLLYGESDNHKLLFAFFDVLFSIGLLGLIRYLSRHLF